MSLKESEAEGKMVSIVADHAKAKLLIDKYGLEKAIFISVTNHSTQTVICGEKDQIEKRKFFPYLVKKHGFDFTVKLIEDFLVKIEKIEEMKKREQSVVINEDNKELKQKEKINRTDCLFGFSVRADLFY